MSSKNKRLGEARNKFAPNIRLAWLDLYQQEKLFRVETPANYLLFLTVL